MLIFVFPYFFLGVFSIMLFLICFFRHFIIPISVDYQYVTKNQQDFKKYILDESAYFGGALIRQLKEVESGEILKGPLACAELFRCYDATGVDYEFPVLVDHNNDVMSFIRKPRINLIRSNQSVEAKVNNILYQYHDNVRPDNETLHQDFKNFKDRLYGYEQ